MTILCLFQNFSFSSSTIYLDLVHALSRAGHRVLIVAGTNEPLKESGICEIDGTKAVFVHFPDQFHAGKIKKGLIQLTIGRKLNAAVKRYFWSEDVDIIIYPTPPVTLAGILKSLKTHFGAINFLMLKDIFPQNAIDLKMMKENSFLHRHFCKVENILYRDSDFIGCMSNGNIQYLKAEHPEIDTGKLMLFPNTVELKPLSGGVKEDAENKDIVTFMFGGNMGKPQAVDFLLKCIDSLKDYPAARFQFIGDGTETELIRDFISKNSPPNLSFETVLPRTVYEERLSHTDVGIVSLSSEFTIPNYPSRILSYMQLSKPVLAVTDHVTDIHALVTYEARCGWWCPSDDADSFVSVIKKICAERETFGELGMNGRRYLEEHFNVEKSVEILETAALGR